MDADSGLGPRIFSAQPGSGSRPAADQLALLTRSEYPAILQERDGGERELEGGAAMVQVRQLCLCVWVGE